MTLFICYSTPIEITPLVNILMTNFVSCTRININPIKQNIIVACLQRKLDSLMDWVFA